MKFTEGTAENKIPRFAPFVKCCVDSVQVNKFAKRIIRADNNNFVCLSACPSALICCMIILVKGYLFWELLNYTQMMFGGRKTPFEFWVTRSRS